MVIFQFAMLNYQRIDVVNKTLFFLHRQHQNTSPNCRWLWWWCCIPSPRCSMVLEYPQKWPSFVGKYTSTMEHMGHNILVFSTVLRDHTETPGTKTWTTFDSVCGCQSGSACWRWLGEFDMFFSAGMTNMIGRHHHQPSWSKFDPRWIFTHWHADIGDPEACSLLCSIVEWEVWLIVLRLFHLLYLHVRGNSGPSLLISFSRSDVCYGSSTCLSTMFLLCSQILMW